MPMYASQSISLADFNEVLSRYKGHVKPDLEDLDTVRFEKIPETIAERMQDQKAGEAVLLLTKDEVVDLVTWKLKHGTFRPKLKQLVESNPEDFVHTIMRDLSTSEGPAKDKLQMLTKIKGVGPATASLILSCIWPFDFAFFSDELFRWLHWDGRNADGSNASIKAGKGWSRPIGYTPKEYESLITRCKVVQERLNTEDKVLSFLDLERVAYVLGKEKVEIVESSKVDESDDEEPVKASKADAAVKKRPANEPTTSNNRASRSKRAKK